MGRICRESRARYRSGPIVSACRPNFAAQIEQLRASMMPLPLPSAERRDELPRVSPERIVGGIDNAIAVAVRERDGLGGAAEVGLPDVVVALAAVSAGSRRLL